MQVSFSLVESWPLQGKF